MTVSVTFHRRAIKKGEDYHINSPYWFRCYDLENNFGATGASIAATRGRYVWLCTADHPQPVAGMLTDGNTFYIGYSSDPGVPPETMATMWVYDDQPPHDASTLGDSSYPIMQAFLFHNPDDAAG